MLVLNRIELMDLAEDVAINNIYQLFTETQKVIMKMIKT